MIEVILLGAAGIALVLGMEGWALWDMYKRHKARIAQLDRIIETIEEINQLLEKGTARDQPCDRPSDEGPQPHADEQRFQDALHL